MTVADDIEFTRLELHDLYARQRSLERAPLDCRVANEAERIQAIGRNAERIRRLQRTLDELEREAQEDEAA